MIVIPPVLPLNEVCPPDVLASTRILVDSSGTARLKNCPRNDGTVAKLDNISPRTLKRKASVLTSPSTQNAVIVAKKLAFHGPPRRTYRPPQANEEQFQYFWRRLYQCNKYVKYRNGYDDGRVLKGVKVEKWPAEREEAFFRGTLAKPAILRFLTVILALLTWEPCGRQKKAPRPRGGRPLPAIVKNHVLGRNELIALFINDWFGFVYESELIDRKMISSHIQVLKGYFGPVDPWIAWHLGLGLGKGKTQKAEPSHPQTYSDLLSSLKLTGFYEPVPSSLESVGHRLLPRPLNVLPSQMNVKDHRPALQPHMFFMDIQDPSCRSTAQGHNCERTSRECKFNTKYTISKLQENQIAPRCLEEVQGWEGHFPHLHQLGQGRVPDCDVLFAESSLALDSNQIREYFRLSIGNSFRTIEPGMARNYEWECRTQIYENGDFRELVDDADHKGRNLPQITPDNHDASLLHIALRSAYWVKTLHYLAGRLRNAANESLANSHGRGGAIEKGPLRKAEEEVRNAIKGITFMQEIFIVDRNVPNQRKRVTIMYWRFRQTHKEEIGLTTWRTFFPSPTMPQHYVLPDYIPTTAGGGGLNMSIGSGFSQFPRNGTILPSQSSYGGPSMQHEMTLLTSAAHIDPSAYEFEMISAQLDSQSEVQSMSSHESAVGGAEYAQGLNFEEALPFQTTILPSSDVNVSVVALSDSLQMYDNVVIDDVSNGYWSQEHADADPRIASEELYNLNQPIPCYRGLTSENSQGVLIDPYERHGPILGAAEQMLLAQQHQHFTPHLTHHNYQTIEEMLDEGKFREEWMAQNFPPQQHFNYQEDHDSEILSPTALLQVTQRAHYALQDAQQHVQQHIHTHDHEEEDEHVMICMDDALDPRIQEQVIDSVAELDWEVILPAECGVPDSIAVAAGTGSPVATLVLAQPQPKKPVPSLLPSAFEN